MSVVSTVIRLSNIKLLVALAIPLGIGWLFIYSQQQAIVEEAKYRAEQRAHPNADTVATTNYSLREIDDNNHIHWQLVAKRGVIGASGHDVSLQDVTVDYFDGPALKMRLVAPVGEAQEATRYVKLQGAAAKKVEAIGEGGKAKLVAQTVELMKKNQFLATGGVTIEWPEVAKVTGDSATGTINLSNLRDFQIVGNTHAVIFMH